MPPQAHVPAGGIVGQSDVGTDHLVGAEVVGSVAHFGRIPPVEEDVGLRVERHHEPRLLPRPGLAQVLSEGQGERFRAHDQDQPPVEEGRPAVRKGVWEQPSLHSSGHAQPDAVGPLELAGVFCYLLVAVTKRLGQIGQDVKPEFRLLGWARIPWRGFQPDP